MIIERTLFQDVMPCSSLEVHQCFGGRYRHCPQGKLARSARNLQESGSKLVARLTLQLWKFFRTAQHYIQYSHSLDGWGIMVHSLAGSRDFFLFSNMSVPALRTTQPPNQWVSWAVSHWVKLTIHIHVVPRLKMCRAIPPLSHRSSWCCA
jgi:hypothetical protein